jgi:hypothetical protein
MMRLPPGSKFSCGMWRCKPEEDNGAGGGGHRRVFIRIECIPMRLEGLEMSDLRISAAAAAAARNKRALAFKTDLPASIMQNLQRFAVKRVGFGVLRNLVFDARYNGILVVIQPGGGVGAGGGVDQLVAAVRNDLSALHSLRYAELDQMIAPAHAVSRDVLRHGNRCNTWSAFDSKE